LHVDATSARANPPPVVEIYVIEVDATPAIVVGITVAKSLVTRDG
jgi:hypothetical protein